ncbi:MAG: hypothetical protein QOJ96_2347, partial [Alphaproteobacteria bacterium]|nr:hypothetical protein [Alphaproteobacteria bacterium]
EIEPNAASTLGENVKDDVAFRANAELLLRPSLNSLDKQASKQMMFGSRSDFRPNLPCHDRAPSICPNHQFCGYGYAPIADCEFDLRPGAWGDQNFTDPSQQCGSGGLCLIVKRLT